MFATLLAAIAVVIALQALRLASKDRIVIQVMPDELPAKEHKPLQLPPFLERARPMPRVEPSFQPGRPLDVHHN